MKRILQKYTVVATELEGANAVVLNAFENIQKRNAYLSCPQVMALFLNS